MWWRAVLICPIFTQDVFAPGSWKLESFCVLPQRQIYIHTHKVPLHNRPEQCHRRRRACLGDFHFVSWQVIKQLIVWTTAVVSERVKESRFSFNLPCLRDKSNKSEKNVVVVCGIIVVTRENWEAQIKSSTYWLLSFNWMIHRLELSCLHYCLSHKNQRLERDRFPSSSGASPYRISFHHRLSC